MLNNPAWSAFYLWKNGEVVPENAARCPRTMQALQDVPLARVPNRSPSILFSLLQPGAHIPPHNGLVNTRLICHLPLLVPGQCTFRVGNEMRDWQKGNAWLFDDTIEHEAWNRSDADASHPAVRRVAAGAFAGRARAGRLAVRVDRRARRRPQAGMGNLIAYCTQSP